MNKNNFKLINCFNVNLRINIKQRKKDYKIIQLSSTISKNLIL